MHLFVHVCTDDHQNVITASASPFSLRLIWKQLIAAKYTYVYRLGETKFAQKPERYRILLNLLVRGMFGKRLFLFRLVSSDSV